MLCIGIAEWLINYDTFFLFFQVPAIAAGTTIMLGVLLAFAAHGHGTLLRQWSHRFGRIGRRRSGAATGGCWRWRACRSLIVLGAAGASRYAAAMRALTSQPQFNILGAEAAVVVDPLRDVLLSLLANIAAWLVGVFIAYVAHDADPEYMEATHEADGRAGCSIAAASGRCARSRAFVRASASRSRRRATPPASARAGSRSSAIYAAGSRA